MRLRLPYAESMRTRARLGKLLCIAGALAGSAQAAVLTLSAERIAVGPAQADALHLRIVEGDGAPAELALSLKRADSGLGWRFEKLDWHCPVQRDGAVLGCEGEVRADGLRRRLAATVAAAESGLSLSQGKRRIQARYLAATPGRVRVGLHGVPATWAGPFLARLWQGGQLTQGSAGGEVDIGLAAAEPLAVEARLQLRALGLDSPDGSLAAAGLDGTLRLSYRDIDGGQIAVDGRLDGGELLAGALYAALAGAPVAWSLRAQCQHDGDWLISPLRWDDPAGLRVGGQVRVSPRGALESFEVSLDSGDLAALARRYLSGPLGLAGLADLQLHGAARLEVAGDEGGRLRRWALRPQHVVVTDPGGRFSIAGLDGALAWSAQEAAEPSVLRWDGAAIYGLGLGPVQLRLSSGEREIRLDEALALDLLGGRLELERFAFTPAAGERGARAELGLRLAGLDLEKLSQRLGWPAFTGSVSGRLPAARYADGRLVFEGGLSMQVFDGSVAIEHLAMERPLGTAPSLSADVRFDGLDLQPLTRAFGFGEITGRLQGHILGLRLLDWAPAAFDAQLRSDPAYRGKRRISQRAVREISSIGGSGLAAGLQAQMLKMFSTFGYRRLGLRCRLANDVCAMDGIGSAGNGYTIVEGAGLPRIHVVGFQRRVDWPILVDRLKVATQGQMPIVE